MAQWSAMLASVLSKVGNELQNQRFDLIAKFNFKASSIVEIGEKLQFSRAQYVAAKNDGIREVLKRMEKAM